MDIVLLVTDRKTKLSAPGSGAFNASFSTCDVFSWMMLLV
jgi:hypothetical protein